MITSKDNYTIRKIKISDNPKVKEIILTVMSVYGCIGEGYSSSDPEVDSMFEYYNNDYSSFFVVVDQDDQALGCGGIGPLEGADSHTCELKKMYFNQEIRGLGLGQKMMDTCLNAAIEMRYKYCYLETLEAMEAANHLYLKNGFKKLTQPVGATGHSGCDAYFLKTL